MSWGPVSGLVTIAIIPMMVFAIMIAIFFSALSVVFVTVVVFVRHGGMLLVSKLVVTILGIPTCTSRLTETTSDSLC